MGVMSREKALELMYDRVKTKNLQKHILSVEAVMKALAQRLEQDEERWGLCGLLHDLDYDVTKDSPERHTYVTEEWLREYGMDKDIISAIKAHAGKKERETMMEKAVYCSDPITGFLVACALIRPEKSLEPVDVNFVKNRLKEKRFAAGADREKIYACEDLGLSLDEFIQIALDAMKSIRKEIGL